VNLMWPDEYNDHTVGNLTAELLPLLSILSK
jgi:hypothetical protein